MSQSTLSRELALGIGLAARALPDTTPKQLVEILAVGLGLPLTVTKLQSMSLSHYQKLVKKGLQQSFNNGDVQRSLSHLQAIELVIDHGAVQPYTDDMPYSIRLAFASDDGVIVNDQFSVCKQFYIYQIAAEQEQLIAIRVIEIDDALKAEQKQQYRADLIQDCDVLYSLAIGGQAAAKLVKHGVHPMKLNDGAKISDIIDQLQHVLLTPPPWLAKSMGLATSHTLQEEIT